MSASASGPTCGESLVSSQGDSVSAGSITVRFLGGSLVPGLPRQAIVSLSGPITVEELVGRLEPVVGISDLKSKIEHHFAVLVNGTSLQHLSGWSTEVKPGTDVSVVAPMGGGGLAQ